MKIFYKTVFIVFLIALFLPSALYLKLRNSSIDIGFLQNIILPISIRKNTTYDSILLFLDTEKNILKVKISKLHYESSRIKFIKLAKGLIFFDIKSLLKFRYYPDKVILLGLDVGLYPVIQSLESDSLKRTIEKFINFTNITINKGSIAWYNITGDLSALFNLHMNFHKNNGNISLKNSHGNGIINASISYKSTLAKLDIMAKASNFHSDVLEKIMLQEIKNFLFADSLFDIKYVYFLDEKRHYTFVNGNIKKAQFSLDSTHKPINLSDIKISTILSNNLLNIKNCTFLINDSLIKFSSLGNIQKNKSLNLKTSITIPNISLKKINEILGYREPSELQNWLKNNISTGNLTYAILNINHTFSIEKDDLLHHIVDYNGKVILNNMTVRYIDTFPQITNLDGNILFDKHNFDVKIKSGISNGIKIKSGTINIKKSLGNKNPILKLNLLLKGKLKNILTIINNKPLHYADVCGLSPNNSTGNASVDLKMSLPLQSPFNNKLIKTYVKSQINNINLIKVTKLKLNYKNATCSLLISPNEIILNSKGNVSNNPTSIKLKHLFKENNTVANISTKLNKNLLKILHLKYNYLIKNNCDLNLVYRVMKNKKTIAISSDITPLDINFLLFIKKQNEKANLNLILNLDKNDNLLSIKDFSIKSINNNWQIDGEFNFFDNTIKDVDLEYIKGKNTSKLSIKNHEKNLININLSGDELSLDNCSFSKFLKLSNSANNGKIIRININIKKLLFGSVFGLKNNQLSGYLKNNKVLRMIYTAQLEGIRGKAGKVQAQIVKSKYGRIFKLEANNGGELLKSLNLFNNIGDGSLKILANNDEFLASNEWIGKLHLVNFNLYKAPFISKIFAIIFPAGIVDLTTNAGMKFNSYKARFSLSKNTLNIYSSKAYGNSTGILLDGYVGLTDKSNINLQGAIIPAYLINSLLSNIPLLGNLFTGGNNSIFAFSFNITGLKNNPKISVNPFSALTPGILQNLWGNRSNENYKDKWLNDENVTVSLF